MSVSTVSNQVAINPQNVYNTQPNSTVASKAEDNRDTFISEAVNRAKDDYTKQTKTPIGKILFWLGTIGSLIAIGGLAATRK